MGKGREDKRSRSEREMQEIKELENVIRKRLEEIGLSHIRFHSGDFKRQYPHLEYRTVSIDSRECKKLQNYFLEVLTSPLHPEIDGIEYSRPYQKSETIRATIIINPIAEIFDKEGFITSVLRDIASTLEFYQKRK